jgi:hypothetical protein
LFQEISGIKIEEPKQLGNGSWKCHKNR